jgi:hypothetical protein
MKNNNTGQVVQSNALLAFSARYAWLRERFTQLIVTTGCADSNPRMVLGISVNDRFSACDPESVDKAIDAAMANAERQGRRETTCRACGGRGVIEC